VAALESPPQRRPFEKRDAEKNKKEFEAVHTKLCVFGQGSGPCFVSFARAAVGKKVSFWRKPFGREAACKLF